MFKIIGYYICERLTAPGFLGFSGSEMISVSSCFSGIHPDLTHCYFANSSDVNAEYCKKWDIDSQKAAALQNDITILLKDGLSADGRFSDLSAAKKMCAQYFDADRCEIVSVSTTKKYYAVLSGELSGFPGGLSNILPDAADRNELLGFDILGWDIGGFHSFLCNSLHKELVSPKFNNHCLLADNFEVVESFASQIQGKGEPVEWIPCRIGRCK